MMFKQHRLSQMVYYAQNLARKISFTLEIRKQASSTISTTAILF